MNLTLGSKELQPIVYTLFLHLYTEYEPRVVGTPEPAKLALNPSPFSSVIIDMELQICMFK